MHPTAHRNPAAPILASGVAVTISVAAFPAALYARTVTVLCVLGVVDLVTGIGGVIASAACSKRKPGWGWTVGGVLASLAVVLLGLALLTLAIFLSVASQVSF